jgi:hypothetical protein
MIWLPTHELRDTVRERMQHYELSYRNVQALTGVSFSTIGRFLNGGTITEKNAGRLNAWLNDEPIPKGKAVARSRICIGGVTFLMTLEVLDDTEITE